LASLQGIDLTALPYKTSMPYLIVHGDNDPVIETPNSNHISALPAHGHFIRFEGSGHFPMLDQPAKFNRLLVDFLSLMSGVSPRHLQIKEEWKRRVR
jgi:pimeloyl-ACP methyl ester carboxylesterase